jgi:hypothetical protein
LVTENTENTEKSSIPSVLSVCSVAIHPYENRCSVENCPPLNKPRFVNVARWKSEDDWKAAIEAGEKHRTGKGIDRLSGWTDLGIKGYPATYSEEMRY